MAKWLPLYEFAGAGMSVTGGFVFRPKCQRRIPLSEDRNVHYRKNAPPPKRLQYLESHPAEMSVTIRSVLTPKCPDKNASYSGRNLCQKPYSLAFISSCGTPKRLQCSQDSAGRNVYHRADAVAETSTTDSELRPSWNVSTAQL